MKFSVAGLLLASIAFLHGCCDESGKGDVVSKPSEYKIKTVNGPWEAISVYEIKTDDGYRVIVTSTSHGLTSVVLPPKETKVEK